MELARPIPKAKSRLTTAYAGWLRSTDTRLVQIRRADPEPGFRNRDVCGGHELLPPTRRAPAVARSGTGYDASQSSPGM